MNEIEVLYTLGKNGIKPTQGYEDDYAHDVYASEGKIVPPSSFKSIMIPTELKTAFDPIEAGLKVSLRSGIALKTPLIVSNAPGIIEGDYRNGIGILVRNTFIDNSLVDFLFDEKGNKVMVDKVPNKILKEAREFHLAEAEQLGYGELNEETQKMLYKTHVPRGTVYIAKHTRIAQLHMQAKLHLSLTRVNELPESIRGERGFGSSGTTKGGK